MKAESQERGIDTSFCFVLRDHSQTDLGVEAMLLLMQREVLLSGFKIHLLNWESTSFIEHLKIVQCNIQQVRKF